MPNKKEKPKKENVEERIEKDKLKKEVEEKVKDKEIKQQNKILKGILITIGAIILLILVWFLIAQGVRTFGYSILDFEVVQEGELIFYRTSLPVVYQGQPTEYNFYLRNDARKLEKKVDFKGNLNLKNTLVLNLEQDFNCEGKGVIAIANLLKLYEFVGIKVITDKNATCDEESRYTFIQILEGSETRIEQTGESCYNIYINDCEILEGTERMMIETLIKVKETINESETEN
jgi:hypothetical protein